MFEHPPGGPEAMLYKLMYIPRRRFDALTREHRHALFETSAALRRLKFFHNLGLAMTLDKRIEEFVEGMVRNHLLQRCSANGAEALEAARRSGEGHMFGPLLLKGQDMSVVSRDLWPLHRLKYVMIDEIEFQQDAA